MFVNFLKVGFIFVKIVVGGVVLVGLGMVIMVYVQSKFLVVVDKVELDCYLGVWYEIVCKFMYF